MQQQAKRGGEPLFCRYGLPSSLGIQLLKLFLGHAEIDFVIILPARINHPSQSSFFLKAQLAMQVDRCLIEGVHIYGRLLVAQLQEVMLQHGDNHILRVALAPVGGQDGC